MTRRVAIVCPDYHPRTCGVGDHAMRTAAELHRRGDEAAIFCRGPAFPHPDAPGVSVSGFTGPTPLVIAARVAAAAGDWRPTDLLIEYTPHMLGAWRFGSSAVPLLTAAARARGVRVIVNAHELAVPWSTRPDLSIAAASQRAQIAALLALADRFVVTTESRRRQVEGVARALGRDVDCVPVGPNALPVRRSPANGTFRLGCFSTLGSGMRIDVLLEAFERVAAAVPEAELVLVGDFGETRRAREVRAAIAAQPRAGRIRVTGKLALPEVAREVAALDVYLFAQDNGATTRSGTLPLAMGAGVPVVAIRGAETSDLFADGVNVVFADALTGKAFATAAALLHADPALAARVSEGTRRTYERHLSWERIVPALFGQPAQEPSG